LRIAPKPTCRTATPACYAPLWKVLSGLRKRPAVRKSDGMSKSATLLPRFNLRTLLAILTASAVVFVMVGTAFRGQYWAWGVTIAIISCIITALSHAAWFGIVSFIARMYQVRDGGPVPARVGVQMVPPMEHRVNESTGQDIAVP
jgi:hypothetical protein